MRLDKLIVCGLCRAVVKYKGVHLWLARHNYPCCPYKRESCPYGVRVSPEELVKR